MGQEEFFNLFIINQSKKLIDNKSYLAAIIILTIGIEIMGGFFDKKPLKSPKQSKARFKVAVEKLFGGKYAAINRDDSFYEMVRNQLIHSLTIGNKLQISLDETHLLNNDGFIIFNPLIYFDDVCKAKTKLSEMLMNKKAFTKRIPDSSIDISLFV